MASVKSKFLGYVLDELGTGAVEFCRKGARRRKVVGAIRSLVKVRGLQLEGARILRKT